MSNESIGKISLDMEVQDDLDKQIKEAAENIGKQIANAVNKSGLDGQLSRLVNNMTKLLNSNLKKTMDDLSRQIDVLLKKMTQVQMPTGKAPRKVVLPKKAEMDVNTPRGPPTVAPKTNVGVNTDVLKSQMETIQKEMDLVESKIGGQKQKLAELRKQYDATFNDKKKNQLNEQILKTESSVVRLIKKMDALGLKYSNLENKMQSATKIKGMPAGNVASESVAPSESTIPKDIARNASKNFSGLPKLMNTTTKAVNKTANGFHIFGNATKSAKKSNDYFKNGLGGTMRQMFKWMIVLPMIVKGITAMAQSLSQSLMTNEQFSNSLAQIRTNLMVAFTPIYQAILPAINTLMAALAKASAYVASFISQLFGKTYQQSFQATQGLIDAKDAMGVYGTASDKAADSVKGAAKANEVLQRSLMGFDAINKIDDNSNTDTGDDTGNETVSNAPVLVQPSIDPSLLDAATIPWVEKFKNVLARIFDPFKEAWAAEGQNTINSMKTALGNVWQLIKDIGESFLDVWTNGSGTLVLTNILQIFQGIFDLIGNIAGGLDEAWNKNETGTAIVQALFDIFNTILGTIRNIISATADWAGKLDFSPLLTSVKKLLEAIAPFTETVGKGLEWFWNNVLLPIAGWAIQTAVPTFLDMLSAALEALNTVLTVLQPLGQWLFDNLLKPLAEWAGDVFILAMQTITDLLKNFSDWCLENPDTIQNIAIIVASFFAAWKLTTFVSGIVDAIAKAGGLIGILKKLGSGFNPVVLSIGAAIAIGVLLWKNWDTISAKAKEVWEFVKKKFQEFMDFLKNVFTHDWTTEFGVIGKVVNGLLKNITNIVRDIKQVFKGIIDFVVGVFTGDWSRAWDGIKNILSGVWNSFVDIVKSPLNIVIGLVNGLLYGIEVMVNGIAGALNSISIDLPGWLEDLTGFSSIGFDLSYWSAPQIPYLAQGGYVKANTPQLAMIGDNKQHGEIVAPENKMQEMVNAAVKAVAGTGGVSKAELESIVNNAVTRIVAALGQMGFYLDGELLARAVQAIQDGLDVRYNPVKVI